MYNVILRLFRVNVVVVGKQSVLHILCVCLCFCSLCYPAWKAHAPYYMIICVLSGFTELFHIISQTARFSEKSYWIYKVYFGFLYNF